jgi:thioesterase domain-containing protein/acyl carrier protein
VTTLPVIRRSDLCLSTSYVAPEGQAEIAIAEIWQRVLNVDQIGVKDDFFDIGGDSLAATALASALQDDFSLPFTPSSIIGSSTVAAQAALLSPQQTTQSGSLNALPAHLTLINKGGSKPPLFIVHGAAGFTMFDKRFLDGFDSDQPIGFFEAPGLDGKEQTPERVEEFAERYLKTIRQVAPESNWMIAASCTGGLIALEMCVQAQQQGEHVSRLMLLDPFDIRNLSIPVENWQWHRPTETKVEPKSTAFESGLQKLRRMLTWTSSAKTDKPKTVNPTESQPNPPTIEERIQLRISDEESIFVPSAVAYNADAMRQAVSQFLKAITIYHPGCWSGEAFILSTSSRIPCMPAWKNHLPNLKYRPVDFDHYNLFTNGLPTILAFLHDAMGPNPGERISS